MNTLKTSFNVLYTNQKIKPNLTYETELKPGTTNELQGKYGGFRPGVNIRLGGKASDAINIPQYINPGIVLNTFPHLKPILKYEQKYKPNSVYERVGNVGGIEYNPKKYINSFVNLVELDCGTVLNTCSSLRPDLRYELQTNIIGGRSNEAYAKRAGFYNRYS